jgi:hypothetical protein
MLTFDPIKHKYKWNGVEVPGVTSILKDVGIIDYSNAPEKAMEYGKERGTAAHEATRLYDKGELEIVETLELPVWRPYLDAWIAFKKDTGFSFVEIEQPLYSQKYGFAGTVDRVGTMGALAILDIKTGVTIPAWTAIQTAAYEIAYNEGKKVAEKTKKRYGVLLKNDGKYSIKEYKDKTDVAVFLSALSVYNYKRGVK